MIFLQDNNKINFLLVSIIILYPFSMAFQGIDMIDGSFNLVLYENFFSHPENSVFLFYNWLSIFFGALVNEFFGWMGWLGFKLAYVLVLYVTLYLVYAILRPYSNKTTLLFIIFLTMLFVNIGRVYIIHYNNLTTLFYILAALFLYSGLVKVRINYIFLSGVILGLNIYIRFSNLLGIGLIFAILYYGIATNSSKKIIILQTLSLIVGYIFSIIGILMIMSYINHYDLYVENIRMLLVQTQNPEFHHNGSSMLMTTIKLHILAYTKGLIFIASFFALISMSKLWNKNKTFVWLSSIFFSLVLIYFLYRYSLDRVSFVTDPLILGTFFILLLWLILKNYNQNPKFGLLALIAYIIYELIPLGSNTGFRNSAFGLYLAMPIVLVYLFSLKKTTIFSFSFSKHEIYFMKVQIVVGIVLYALIFSNIFYASWQDARERWTMRYPFEHQKLRGVLTTKERAEAINTLMQHIHIYSKDYKYITTFEKVPVAVYLSGLFPFTNLAAPMFYMSDTLQKKLTENVDKYELPLVVTSKVITHTPTWPQNKIKIVRKKGGDYISNQFELEKKRKIMDHFLQKYNYKTVWEDENFKILIPSKQNLQNESASIDKDAIYRVNIKGEK